MVEIFIYHMGEMLENVDVNQKFKFHCSYKNKMKKAQGEKKSQERNCSSKNADKTEQTEEV